jgi:hypothetical protein
MVGNRYGVRPSELLKGRAVDLAVDYEVWSRSNLE